MNTLKIEKQSSWSNANKKPKDWQWAMAGLLYPLSILITIIGSTIMKLGNILMFDTHHLSIEITPKE